MFDVTTVGVAVGDRRMPHSAVFRERERELGGEVGLLFYCVIQQASHFIEAVTPLLWVYELAPLSGSRRMGILGVHMHCDPPWPELLCAGIVSACVPL